MNLLLVNRCGCPESWKGQQKEVAANTIGNPVLYLEDLRLLELLTSPLLCHKTAYPSPTYISLRVCYRHGVLSATLSHKP